MSARVRVVVLPVAGLGTRFLPVTKAVQLKGVSSIRWATNPVTGYSLVSEAGLNW